MAIIRNASVWAAGVKISEAQSAELDLNSNATVAIGDGEAIGALQAPFTGQITAKRWSVVGGTASATKLNNAFFDRKQLTVNYGTVDGVLYKCPCIVAQFKTSADMTKGSQESDYTLMLVGKPTRI